MKRIRVAGIIPINNGYALMHRKNVKKTNNIEEYYTFPGGGLEENETLEECLKREIKEEFGIEIEIKKELYKMESKKFNQKEYFFLCKYIRGEFGTGIGPEFSNDPKYINNGEYLPEIVEKEKIEDIMLLPENIKEKFIKDIEAGNI